MKGIVMKNNSIGDKLFNAFNIILLCVLGLSCVLPFVHVLAVSLSDNASATAGLVGLIPKNLTFLSYKFALQKENFIRSMGNSVLRLALGVGLNTLLTILTAYPLSKKNKIFPGRTVISWLFVVTMMINAGLIPFYLVVTRTGIDNTIWSLILPYATPAFNVMILLNYFRGIPHELEESAFVDGAGTFRILFKIYVPLAFPCLATIVIFQSVFHWNEWLWGQIFMNKIEQYPLATYIRNIVVNPNFDNMTIEQIEEMLKLSDRSFKAAQIMLASLPILIVYPFLQRFFVHGMTLGSVKG
jgi:putative aldouronate transport system permease protein